jgi:hypothetical protein
MNSHMIFAMLLALLPKIVVAEPVVEQINAAVEANVPSAEVFGSLLHRDLLLYFLKADNKNTTSVMYQLLRDTPTGPPQWGPRPNQRGAYPTYYLWVRIFSDSTLSDEGAVRVMAIERNRFEVTHFLSRAEIMKNPSLVSKIVPLNLVQTVISIAEAK